MVPCLLVLVAGIALLQAQSDPLDQARSLVRATTSADQAKSLLQQTTAPRVLAVVPFASSAVLGHLLYLYLVLVFAR